MVVIKTEFAELPEYCEACCYFGSRPQRWNMNKNKKECIDDLNYIRKALTKGSLYQHDAIILLIDTIARYLFVDAVNLVDDEKAARHE